MKVNQVTAMRKRMACPVLVFLLLGGLSINCVHNPSDDGPEGNSVNEDSYFIFGHFYGECLGESCVEIFKIADQKLFEDTLDRYPFASQLPPNTEFVQLSNDEYEKVQHLPGLIPEELFSENDVVIGQPDAGDLGGLYLETDMRGEREFWMIDQIKSNIPAYLHTFVDSLNSGIQKLQ